MVFKQQRKMKERVGEIIWKWTAQYLFISTYSISPEKEKNSLRSRSDAPKETLLTFTVFTCKKEKVTKKSMPYGAIMTNKDGKHST
jgi:hypothetical protein